VEKCISNCFRHVCLHISCIDLSFGIKTTIQSELFFYFFVSQVQSKNEQMSIYLFFFLFHIHARLSALITYQSTITEKKIKDKEWKTFFQAWHDRSINLYRRVCVCRKRQSNHLMSPFFFLSYLNICIKTLCFLPFVIRTRKKIERRREWKWFSSSDENSWSSIELSFSFSLAVRTLVTN
jgi:hypothetical protein